jgi:HTH-type transcriptional regulator / antitoxin HigA
VIQNDREFFITQKAIADFRRALEELEANPTPAPGVHPAMVQIQKDAMQSQLDDLLEQIAEYVKTHPNPGIVLGEE